MSGATSPQRGLTRRSFLKTTAVAAGAVAAAGAPTPLTALAEEYASGQKESSVETIYKGACRLNCQNNCALNIHVRDGKVVKTSMRPFPDSAYNRICLRGLSHMGRIYNDKRLKYPLRRVGERGSGEWERITWEEALEEIANKINEVKRQYGPKAIALMTGSGNEGLVHGNCGTVVNFFQRLGGTYIGRSCDMSVINGMLRTAMPYQNPDASEWKHCDVFVVWAANLTESNLQSWHFVVEQQERGMKLLVIDSQFSTVASKADLWIHPRQGSDAAFGMGVLRILIENGWYDAEFVLRRTNAPFLIREDTKKVLRGVDVGMAGEDAKAAICWDNATGSFATIDAAEDPLLEGSFVANGIAVSTCFTLLRQACADYTDEKVEEITGVAPEELGLFARMYGTATNAHVLMGYGTDHYYHGQIPAHAATIMQAITGNLENPGGGIGTYPGYQFPWDTSLTAPLYAEPADFNHSQLAEVVESGAFMGREYPIKILWNSSGNPVSNYCRQKKWTETILPKIDLFVCTEITENDTTALADIVLPVCHWFESFDLPFKCGAPYMFYSEKAIEPQFESKSETDIVRLLAPKVGVENVWLEDDIDLCREVFERSDSITQLGPEYTFDNLLVQGFLAYPAAQVKKDVPLFTPSGRYELYLETPASMYLTDKDVESQHDYLPVYYPQSEIDNVELRKKYPLSVNNSHPRWRVHSSFWEVSWLQDMEGEPICFINPLDAEARGIANGDHVRVFNERGEVVARAVLSEGIQPGSMDIPKGNQRTQNLKGAYNEISTDVYNPINVQQAWFDTLVEVEKA